MTHSISIRSAAPGEIEKQEPAKGSTPYEIIYYGTFHGQPVSIHELQHFINQHLYATDSFCRVYESLQTIKPHPIVEKFYGYSMTEFAIISERLDPNRNLMSFLHPNHCLTPTQKSIIAYTLACGLLHTHSFDVCHRFINCNSIYIDDNFKPRITSFFFSRVSSLNNPTRHHYGELAQLYVAPEILNSQSYGPAVDVYSYGMILYSLLYDGVPFLPAAKHFDNDDQLRHLNSYHFCAGIRNGQRPQFDEAEDPVIVDLIKRCWDQTPEKRPTFLDIVLQLRYSGPLFVGTNPAEYEANTREAFEKIHVKDEDAKRFDSEKINEFKTILNELKTKSDFRLYLRAANFYEEGIGCPKNIQEAIKCYDKAVITGNPTALFKYGYFLSIIDPKNSVQYLERACKSDLLPAYSLLARVYANKYKELKISQQIALSKSVEYDSKYLNNVQRYQQYINSPQTFRIKLFYAIDLIKLAQLKYSSDPVQMNQKLEEAQGILESVLAVKDERGNSQFPEALTPLYELYKQLHKNREAEALLNDFARRPNFAWYLLKGKQSEEEHKYWEALRFYEQSISKGSIRALYQAASIYENLDKYIQYKGTLSDDFFVPDYMRAAELYQECANLDTMYIPNDFHDVIRLSQYRFGMMLLNAYGVFQSYLGAISYFEQAILGDCRIVEAMVELGYIYTADRQAEDEAKVEKNLQKARYYLEMAIHDPIAKPEVVQRAQQILSTLPSP